MAIAVLTLPDKQGGDFLVIMDWKKGVQKGVRIGLPYCDGELLTQHQPY